MSPPGGAAATQLATDPGTVMGTVGYMAPEQVRGDAADARTDIFALGCVLFEMLTGRRAFQRETAAETMTAILREDVAEVPAADARVPPALDQVIRHCLEKQPDERFQSARDLSFALQSLSGAQAASGRAAVKADAGGPRARRNLLPWIAAAAVAALAFAVGRMAPAPSSAPGAPAIMSFEQITDAPGVETTPTLSPDGQTIVYESAGDLYLLRVGSRRPVLLTMNSPEPDEAPAFSPDGERIAFRSGRDSGGIFVMTATGESVTRLSDFGFGPSWSPDGASIVVSPSQFAFPTDIGSSARGLSVIDVATGARREISRTDRALQPAWSPHGYRIAFWGLRGDSGQRDLWTIAADGSEIDAGGRSVTDDAPLDWNPVWSPDGRYLYFSSSRGGTMNLWRVAIDESTGDVRGEPEPLTTPSLWSGGFSFSRDGRHMAYASLDWRSTLYRVPFDPDSETLTGPAEPLRRSTRPMRDHELSPDGQWIAFMETGTQEDLFVARTDGSEYRRLTDDEFRDRGPVWSPDGTSIAFYSDRGGDYQVWTIRPDGSDARQVSHYHDGVNMPAWSPDGRQIASSAIDSGHWFVVPATAPGEQKATEYQMPGGQFWPLSWSRTGRILGLDMAPSGVRTNLDVYDRGTGKYLELVGAPNFIFGLWLDDTRVIFRDNRGIAIASLDGRQHRLIDIGGYYVGRSVGLSGGGRWITYTETGTAGDIWLATLQ